MASYLSPCCVSYLTARRRAIVTLDLNNGDARSVFAAAIVDRHGARTTRRSPIKKQVTIYRQGTPKQQKHSPGRNTKPLAFGFGDKDTWALWAVITDGEERNDKDYCQVFIAELL